MRVSRRTFLVASGSACLASGTLLAADPTKPGDDLRDEVGVTTSSLSGHLAAQAGSGKFTLLELPRIMRDELGMKVIDLNTSSLASTKAEYLDRCREAAEAAGCVFTNLKMNQRELDLGSRDDAVRARSLKEYKGSIDAAARLGCRWARPLPVAKKPDMGRYIEDYRALADYAAEKNVQMLVENFGWMQADPEALPAVVKEVGRNIAGCPDTGNWDSDELRSAGLAKAFPLAVTCDFKFRQLGPDGEHALYDLERCYRLGREAGFRGPWCLEHANADRTALFKELILVRDRLRAWMKLDS